MEPFQVWYPIEPNLIGLKPVIIVELLPITPEFVIVDDWDGQLPIGHPYRIPTVRLTGLYQFAFKALQ